MQDSPPSKPILVSRKGKERETPQITDFAERMVALRRKQTVASRTQEKPDRPLAPPPVPTRALPPSPRKLPPLPYSNPNIVISQASPMHATADPDEHDFSRRLKISAVSPRTSHSRAQNGASASGRLFNPHADPQRKVIYAEPDAISDTASSSYAPRNSPAAAPRSQAQRGNADHRQLFDHRKHDPVRFHALAGSPPVNSTPANGGIREVPTPKSSGEYVSASSTSYSAVSSTFTLSSNTDTSSASSAIFDNARRSEESAPGNNALATQLKKLYRAISTLENTVMGEDKDTERDDEPEREGQRVGVLVRGRLTSGGSEIKGVDEEERERWRRQVSNHKELAEKIHHLLSLTLAPTIPASLRNIPVKYNLIIRLWTHAFHRLLESLRRSAMPPTSSMIALEHLQDFIYYAYVFYTGLLEERNLASFRGAWVEALGDLARYRIPVSVMVDNSFSSSSSLTTSVMARLHPHTPRPNTPNASALSDRVALALPSNDVSPTPAARIDDSPRPSQLNVPSVGVAAARLMELEPEKERWRQIAREWYARGLASTPGTGKLHHHLGLLSRDREGGEDELKGMYHFVKSMITTHPFATSRESILPLWSVQAQARRQAPDAKLTELFVCLHGMLFTNIQLDDFQGVLERFDEKLQMIDAGEVVEEREWIMMAVVNIGAVGECWGRRG